MNVQTSEILAKPNVLPLLALRDIPEEFSMELAVLDHTGDTKLIWDRRNAVEVAAAKATFDALKAAGYLAYSVSKAGEKNEIIRAFDPEAESLVLSPPLVGG
jgi:hypothetical protein